MAVEPRRIGVLGGFGMGNSGNEGTLEVMLACLRRIAPTAELLCICTVPDQVARDHAVAAIPLHARPAGRAFRLFNRLLLRVPAAVVDFVRALECTARLDAIVVPGTGVLDDFSSGPLGWPYTILKWSMAARLTRTPTAYVSVGAGPIPNALSRRLMRRAAMMASYRSYRDANSKEFMASIGVDTRADAVYPDLAFAIATDRYKDAQPDDAKALTVGVGVMTYYGWRGERARGEHIYQDYLRKIASFAVWLLDGGHRVRILVGDDADRRMVDDVMRALCTARPDLAPDRLVAEPVHSLHDVMRQVADTDLVVATRFHNIVSALKLGRPAVSIGYSKKNDVLMAEMGLAEFCQHIERLDVEVLKRQFSRLAADRARYARTIRAATADYRRRLEQQEAELAELLTGTAALAAAMRQGPDRPNDLFRAALAKLRALGSLRG